MKRVFSSLAVFLVLTLSAAAQDIGTITLVEGPLRLIRGATIFQAVEGVRLHSGDILESADSGFAQLEFNGGTIVALGSSTRVYLMSFSRAGGRVSAEFVLLSGWLKGETKGAYRYNSPLLAATTQDGTLLIRSAAEAADIFVESGSARIGEVRPGGVLHEPNAVKAGEFASRSDGKNITIAARPSSAFVDSMPHQFRDTLTSLLPRFTNKPPLPKREHEVTYSEIQPWLSMPQAWRKGFVRRFEGRLNDPAFRKSLEAHLKDYPEWDPVLHPERYQPKTSPTTTGNPDAKNGRDTN
jgi:hypothetical protein